MRRVEISAVKELLLEAAEALDECAEGFAHPCEVADRLRAAAAALPEGGAWQTMDTAPIEPFNKDHWYMRYSPYVLLTSGHGIEIGSYGYTKNGKGRWQIQGRTYVPTHWMPLPSLPTPQREQE